MTNWLLMAMLFGAACIAVITMVIVRAVRRSKPPRGFEVLPVDEGREGK